MIEETVEDRETNEREAQIRKSVERSKIWRLIRDALCLERERIYDRRPQTTEELWAREGELRQVQRLLRQGPNLVVIYDRYAREQRAKGAIPIEAEPRPGEPPDL